MIESVFNKGRANNNPVMYWLDEEPLTSYVPTFNLPLIIMLSLFLIT